ncbi:MAG: hypothetical protein EBT91_03390 [Rhodobacteraceae bacterium]|nr:hypothetical protein [Paracoccaceae bacterium]
MKGLGVLGGNIRHRRSLKKITVVDEQSIRVIGPQGFDHGRKRGEIARVARNIAEVVEWQEPHMQIGRRKNLQTEGQSFLGFLVFQPIFSLPQSSATIGRVMGKVSSSVLGI